MRSGVMRIRCRSRLRWRMISWPAANGIRWVKPSSAMLAPSCTNSSMASASCRCWQLIRGRSLDHRAGLLAQVLRQVIERGDRLAGGARTLPAAERLVARPGAGGGALRTVGIGHAGLDVLVEPWHLIGSAVEAGGEAHGGVVGQPHGLVAVAVAMQGEDR